eukprot:1229615-Pleurochrysis_carterae.AAC.1
MNWLPDLISNPNFQNLSVSCDLTGSFSAGEIGDEGCKALAEVLKINQALTSIKLARTHLCLHGHIQLPI